MKPVTVMAMIVPVLLAAAKGRTADLHRVWEQTCGDCHAHAGDFARKFLTVRDGKLQGRHKDDLPVFMGHHYLPQDLVMPMYGMLLAQTGTDPRSKERCGRCHGSAADLAGGP